MMNRLIASLLLCLLVLSRAAIGQESAVKPATPQSSQEDLEQQFAETLSGATLVGRFTVTGMDADAPLKEERYTLGTVRKLKEDLWSIEARIQYGEHDVKLPLALPVKWAGDTPVITVTNVAFPGLGTYTARVVIYGDQYAGTWSGANYGGQLFGKIVRKDAEDEPATEN